MKAQSKEIAVLRPTSAIQWFRERYGRCKPEPKIFDNIVAIQDEQQEVRAGRFAASLREEEATRGKNDPGTAGREEIPANITETAASDGHKSQVTKTTAI